MVYAVYPLSLLCFSNECRFDLLEEEVQVNLKQPHFIERGTQLLQKLGMFIHINMSALPSILVSHYVHVHDNMYMYMYGIAVYVYLSIP